MKIHNLIHLICYNYHFFHPDITWMDMDIVAFFPFEGLMAMRM